MKKKTRVPIPRHQNRAVRTAVLRTLYVGGALSMILAAPNTARLFNILDRGKKRRVQLYRRIDRARAQLIHDGFARKNNGGFLELTERGTGYIERVLAGEYRIPEPVRWDGKWRILMFDIREKRRRVRSQLRLLLLNAGFVRLQDSVWIYPYPCDEFVSLLRAHFSSGVGELRSIVADALESDRALRNHFNLV